MPDIIGKSYIWTDGWIRGAKPGASDFLICHIISKLPDTLGQMFGRFQGKKESNFTFLKCDTQSLWGGSPLHASHFSHVEMKCAAPSKLASSDITYLCLQDWMAALPLSSTAAGLNQYEVLLKILFLIIVNNLKLLLGLWNALGL